MPITSTKISLGLSLGSSPSYSAFTRPTVCIRSRPFHASTAVTTCPIRRHSTVRSLPKRATSKPQTGRAFGTATSRATAASAKCSGMIVSSSPSANSPKTRIR